MRSWEWKGSAINSMRSLQGYVSDFDFMKYGIIVLTCVLGLIFSYADLLSHDIQRGALEWVCFAFRFWISIECVWDIISFFFQKYEKCFGYNFKQLMTLFWYCLKPKCTDSKELCPLKSYTLGHVKTWPEPRTSRGWNSFFIFLFTGVLLPGLV